jgi:hypothetical protein
MDASVGKLPPSPTQTFSLPSFARPFDYHFELALRCIPCLVVLFASSSITEIPLPLTSSKLTKRSMDEERKQQRRAKEPYTSLFEADSKEQLLHPSFPSLFDITIAPSISRVRLPCPGEATLLRFDQIPFLGVASLRFVAPWLLQRPLLLLLLRLLLLLWPTWCRRP